jgi:acyl dehydratase
MNDKAEVVLGTEASYRQITPEMIERERLRIGKPLSRVQPHVEVATKDAIRHWVWGTGDRNPLYLDEEYARSTKWHDIIAPPGMVQCLDRNIIGASMRGFPGIHSWQLGNSFEWFAPILRDTDTIGYSTIESIEEVQSSYAGGLAVDQTIKMDLHDRATGTLLCTARTYLRRFARHAAARANKYGGRQKQSYTDDELREIASLYEQEEIRGHAPRYVEDVVLGESLPKIVRGPITIMDCIAFNIGWGGAYIFANGYSWDFLKKHPGAFPPNESNIPDTPERTHYNDQFAQAVGAPAAFDYGPMRVTWTQTMITNWIGDDGMLTKHRARILKPNYHGDTIYITGQVSGVDAQAGEVHFEMEGRNQLGEVVVDATATAVLPRRQTAG